MSETNRPGSGRSGAGRGNDWGRRHPSLLLWVTLLLAGMVTLLLLSSSQAPVVLYQAF